jgi:carbamoyl-phosphate synthase small subunit
MMAVDNRESVEGYILLADGMRLDGRLMGGRKAAMGYMAANTAVVGFQELVTDPAYKGSILAFTYPEIGNVGVTEKFSESDACQLAGVVVKNLSEFYSHYISEDSLLSLMMKLETPCLTDIDTRALAVHLREAGEMPAAISPADTDPNRLREALIKMQRVDFKGPANLAHQLQGNGPYVAVINLGIRNSELRQLSLCCAPSLFSYDADAASILAAKPAGVLVSDGPSLGLPPQQTVSTIKGLLGRIPILACGLGCAALGAALGCDVTFLRRGHHGANYPVRNTRDGSIELTQQRHSVLLERRSVDENPGVELLYENIDDGSVEGICSADGSAIGIQAVLVASRPGEVNTHIIDFVGGLGSAKRI